ncbi:HIRAN domain-containing protein [Bythopirellula goksoeyrii]|uniref:HIRAN domain-containing protein n=1 Tax=Bythopirellula goksoeyrii TaxID=1400387 RepID=UPI001AEF3C3C|nr:HIRAN domain-containing protein [Bythopirellula goksoeyrii]
MQRAVSTAISDGRVTLSERSQLLEFAMKANISEAEVLELLKRESQQLLDTVIEEALEDGVLDPQERQRIGDLAAGLGLKINLSNEQNHRLHLCDLAYQLAVGSYIPNCTFDDSIQLNSRENAIHQAPFEWHEIVQLKRPAGIPLGNDHYLKNIAAGQCLLTDKRVLLVGDLAAKKFTLASVAKVTKYADGILFNRSSGKSLFLRPCKDLVCDIWAMLAVSTINRDPVLGLIPTKKFIPESLAIPTYKEELDNGWSQLHEPRYTFRVVGDHIGDREQWIARLELGSPIKIQREPRNPYDTNAIAVSDIEGRQLGYLKREVAIWFAPILDRGRQFGFTAFRKPQSGGLIVGVYEID